MNTATADARTRHSYATGDYSPDLIQPTYGWDRTIGYYIKVKTAARNASTDPEFRRRAQQQIYDLQYLDEIITRSRIAKPRLTCYPNGRIEMRWPSPGRTLWVVRQPGDTHSYRYLAVPDRNRQLVADATLWQTIPRMDGFLHRDLPALVRRYTGDFTHDAWFATEISKQVGPWTITVRDEPDQTDTVWTVGHDNAGIIARGRASARRQAQTDAQQMQERIAHILKQPGRSRSAHPRVLRQAAEDAMANHSAPV